VSFDWKKILGGVAPWLATALGGPAAGLATNAILSGLGLSGTVDPSNPKAVEEALASAVATPADLMKLREIETKFQAEMQAAGFAHLENLDRIAADDRKDARNREIQTHDNWTPRGLALFITMGFFGLLAALLKWNVPEANKAVIYTMTGSLGTGWVCVIGYYFGTSAGSRAKDALLYNSTPTDGDK